MVDDNCSQSAAFDSAHLWQGTSKKSLFCSLACWMEPFRVSHDICPYTPSQKLKTVKSARLNWFSCPVKTLQIVKKNNNTWCSSSCDRSNLPLAQHPPTQILPLRSFSCRLIWKWMTTNPTITATRPLYLNHCLSMHHFKPVAHHHGAFLWLMAVWVGDIVRHNALQYFQHRRKFQISDPLNQSLGEDYFFWWFHLASPHQLSLL